MHKLINFYFIKLSLSLLLFTLLNVNANSQNTKTIKNLSEKELATMKVEMLDFFFDMPNKQKKTALTIFTNRYNTLKQLIDTTKTEEENQQKFTKPIEESIKQLETKVIEPSVAKTVDSRIKLISSVIKPTSEQESKLKENLNTITLSLFDIFKEQDKLGKMSIDNELMNSCKIKIKENATHIFKDILSEPIKQKAENLSKPFISELNLQEEQQSTLTNMLSKKVESNINNAILYTKDKKARKDADKELNSQIKEKIYTEFLTDEYVGIQVNKIVSLFSLKKEQKDTLTNIFTNELAEFRNNKKAYSDTPDKLMSENKKTKQKSIIRIDKSILNDVVAKSSKDLVIKLNLLVKMNNNTKDSLTLFSENYFTKVKTSYVKHYDEKEIFRQKFREESKIFAMKICSDLLMSFIKDKAAKQTQKVSKLIGLTNEQNVITTNILVDQIIGQIVNFISYKDSKNMKKQKNSELSSKTFYRLKTEVLTENQRKKLNLVKSVF